MRFSLVAPVVLAALAVGPGRADDTPNEPLEYRLFDVSAITMGAPAFPMGRYTFPLPPDQVDDEENALFGGEYWESSKPFGSIDDVIEIVKRRDPEAFRQKDVSVDPQGTRGIWLIAKPPLQRMVATVLAELSREVLTIATFDVVVLRGDAVSVGRDGIAPAIASGALVPIAGARASATVGMQAVARLGAERTYLADEDVEVFSHATAPDPIMQIVEAGLEFKIDLVATSADRVDARFEGRWVSAGEPRRASMRPSGEPIELFDVEGRRAMGILALTPGEWTLVTSSGDVCFVVRATVRTPAPSAPWPGERWRIEPVSDAGPVALAQLDVRDLTAPIDDSIGIEPWINPSGYTPPEPPELREPCPAVPMDVILDALRQITPPSDHAPDVWNVTERSGWVTARVTQAQAEAMRTFIEGLRRSVRSTRLDATVISLPVESFPEYFTGLDDGATLVADGGRTLLQRPMARAVTGADLRLRPHQRNACIGGREHSYIADYDVEIAEGVEPANPVVRIAFEGFSFDVECVPAPGFESIACTLRIDRSTWGATRSVPTRNGDIECPTLGISRIRGGTVVPMGSHRIVGATLENGIVTLTIVGASSE